MAKKKKETRRNCTLITPRSEKKVWSTTNIPDKKRETVKKFPKRPRGKGGHPGGKEEVEES